MTTKSPPAPRNSRKRKAKSQDGQVRRCLMLELTCVDERTWRDDKHDVLLSYYDHARISQGWTIQHPLRTQVESEIETLDEAVWCAAGHVIQRWARQAFDKKDAGALANLLLLDADAQTARRDAKALESLIRKFIEKCPRVSATVKDDQKRNTRHQVFVPLPPLEQFQQLVTTDNIVFDFHINKKGRDK